MVQEFELPPEMIQAGIDELSNYDSDRDNGFDFVMRLYRAMTAATPHYIDAEDCKWRKRVFIAMKVEVLCVLEGWRDGDEDMKYLSPAQAASLACLRATRAAADPILKPPNGTSKIEIEITREMIDAGVGQLLLFVPGEDDAPWFARFIFAEMIRAAPGLQIQPDQDAELHYQ